MKFCGIDELISTYASLLIYFNPCILSLNSLLDFLKKIKKDIKLTEQNSSLCIEVPLCYDEEFGLDLEFQSNLKRRTYISSH